MKAKNLIFALVGIGFGVVCFITGWWIRNEQCDEDTLCHEYALQIDSLEWMEVIREDEQLPYYNMKKEDVLVLLPPPNRNVFSGFLFDCEKLSQWHWIYDPYKEKLKGTQDTVIVDTYYWEIPYHDRPNLYIVFEKKGKEWITSTCVQWDSERVYID